MPMPSNVAYRMTTCTFAQILRRVIFLYSALVDMRNVDDFNVTLLMNVKAEKRELNNFTYVTRSSSGTALLWFSIPATIGANTEVAVNEIFECGELSARSGVEDRNLRLEHKTVISYGV
jgi:hypothetical protein